MNFTAISKKCSAFLGSAPAFSIAILLLIVWALSGPFFGFSESWQLIVNTTTTIITFLAVFLIQNSQNNDTRAIHLKLDELIARDERMDNLFMKAEKKNMAELDELEKLHVDS